MISPNAVVISASEIPEESTLASPVLSSGISEALITTEFGLIIAIPSLLLHAYLSRRARRTVEGMEKSAISFVNRLSLSAKGDEAEAA